MKGRLYRNRMLEWQRWMRSQLEDWRVGWHRTRWMRCQLEYRRLEQYGRLEWHRRLE